MRCLKRIRLDLVLERGPCPVFRRIGQKERPLFGGLSGLLELVSSGRCRSSFGSRSSFNSRSSFRSRCGFRSRSSFRSRCGSRSSFRSRSFHSSRCFFGHRGILLVVNQVGCNAQHGNTSNNQGSLVHGVILYVSFVFISQGPSNALMQLGPYGFAGR